MNDGDAVKTVWLLSSNRWNSAITEYALSAARSLALMGWRVVFSPLAGSPAESRGQRYNLEMQPFATFKTGELKAFREAYGRIMPDVIMTFGGRETFLARFVPKDRRCQVVRVRGQAISKVTRTLKIKHQLGHSHVAGIIAPSDGLHEIFAPISTQPVAAIPLGCDTARYFRTASLDSPRSREMMVLGRLDPVKGHARLFALTRKLLDRWTHDGPEPSLHVVGEPANLSVADIAEAGREAGLRENTDFCITARRVGNVAEYMSRTGVGVVPSLGSEVICRVAEEFLLCGTPVLVSGVGSLNEMLFEGAGSTYAGLSDDDAVRLMEKMLLESYAESEQEKRARAERARQLYSFEAMGAQLDRFLTEIF